MILPLHFQWQFTVSLCSAGIWRRALLKAEKKRILLSDWGILSQQIAQKWKLWSTSTAILLNSSGYEVVKSKEVEKVKVRDRGPISRSSPHPSKKPSFFWTQVFFDYGSSSSASLLSSAMDQRRNKQNNWANLFFWWPFHHGGVVQWEVWKWGLLWKAGKSSRQKAETK